VAIITSALELSQDLQFFLLACRSERRREATLTDYKRKLGRFVAFLEGQGMMQTSDIQTKHMRLFMLELEERALPRLHQRLLNSLIYTMMQIVPTRWVCTTISCRDSTKPH